MSGNFKFILECEKGETHLVEMDLKKDLKEILEKHWSDIKSYKQILSKQNTLDICNTESYLSKNLPENSISLVLFIDAAPFADSSNGSVWEIFGFIANLPPRLRARFSNILKILFIEGRL